MNFYPHHIGDFRSGTIHLDRLARWLYRDLIEVYYDTERPLPANEEEVCLLVGAVTQTERDAVHVILKRKFQLMDDGYHNNRCDEEIAKYRDKSEKAKISSEAAKAARAVKLSEKAALVSQANSDSAHTITARPTLAHRSVTERSPNQEPVTNNQEPASYTPPGGGVVVGIAEDALICAEKRSNANKAIPPCPHQAIIDLYHNILPMCPAVREWPKARQDKLRARWNGAPERQNLDYWRRLFEYVASIDFLTGREHAQGKRPFYANLEWIVTASNFIKIREAYYEN